MWLLFPPSQTSNLKPSRVPYEESSVYSEFNFFCGCSGCPSTEHAKLVILEPGDVLYVPNKWWHYVENKTSAISINIWIPLEIDKKARIEESLVKCFISSISKSIDEDSVAALLNPSENDLPTIPFYKNLQELEWCLTNAEQKKNNEQVSASQINLEKFTISTISSGTLSQILKDKCKKLMEFKHVTPKIKEDILNCKKLINAFCNPEVLNLVRQQLENNVSQNS